jgi:uncharacterized protein (DUF488 family)
MSDEQKTNSGSKKGIVRNMRSDSENEQKGTLGKKLGKRVIYTIGHGQKSIEDFLECLKTPVKIDILVDIRRLPGSRRYPHFSKWRLFRSLKEAGIQYFHIPGLGGKRDPNPDSKNTSLTSKGFRGYADYMDTFQFSIAYQELIELVKDRKVAFMCAETDWKNCHRHLLSDRFSFDRWRVKHILSSNERPESHKLWKCIRLEFNETNGYTSNAKSLVYDR